MIVVLDTNVMEEVSMLKAPRFQYRWEEILDVYFLIDWRCIMGNNPGGKEGYPYVVVRYYPAVYYRRAVEFSENVQVEPGPDTFTLVEANPFDANGELTVKCREALIEMVMSAARNAGFRMCIVFGEKDAVYVEPDGKSSQRADPPLGGADIGEVA